MTTSKFQVGFAVLLLAGAGLILTLQHRSESVLRAQNQWLHQQLAQLASDNESLSNRLALARIRAAPIAHASTPDTVAATGATAGDAPLSNVLLNLIRGGEAPRLTADQVEIYLKENRRSAGSLLAAYRTSKDPALLREAMAKYPDDPQVAFEAVFDQAASPTERREWLEHFKQAAPDNAVASYISALDYFKSGQTEQALQELAAASGKQTFADYTLERIQADDEAFRSAGYSEAESKMAATWGIALPQLAQFKALGQNMVDLAKSYRQTGDEASFQAALQMTVDLGKRLNGPQDSSVPIISRLVGIALERMALGSLDPADRFGSETVQQQLDQLVQQRSSIKDLVNQSAALQQLMTAQDWINYNNRTLAFGEENAIQWVLNKYGQR